MRAVKDRLRLMPNRAAYARAYDMEVQIPSIRVEFFAAITVLCRSAYSITTVFGFKGFESPRPAKGHDV